MQGAVRARVAATVDVDFSSVLMCRSRGYARSSGVHRDELLRYVSQRNAYTTGSSPSGEKAYSLCGLVPKADPYPPVAYLTYGDANVPAEVCLPCLIGGQSSLLLERRAGGSQHLYGDLRQKVGPDARCFLPSRVSSLDISDQRTCQCTTRYKSPRRHAHTANPPMAQTPRHRLLSVVTSREPGGARR